MRRHCSIHLFIALPLLLFLVQNSHAALQLAPLFNDNMVLQRDRDVPIWGWATPGEKVQVRFADQTHVTTAKADGSWQVTLAPLQTNASPQTLVVEADTTVQVTNILIGEVWICAGQSNMGMLLNEAFDAENEIAKADNPKLRFVRIPATSATFPTKTIKRQPAWKISTPQTAAGFAGVAYFFGQKLARGLDIPIGLIEFDRGATGIEGWVPLTAYNTPGLEAIYREVSSWDPASPIGRAAHVETFAALEAWVPNAKTALAEGRPVPPMPQLPRPSPHRSDPTEIYNGTVHPLAPFALRGVVWYQGESNPGEGPIYLRKLKAMIHGWRNLWDQPTMPFYIVQLANEGQTPRYPDKEDHTRYVPVREAQRQVMELEHTGLIVAIDLGEDMNGHPRNKKDVGERAALWALNKQYGIDVPYSGPLYREHTIEGSRVTVHFDYADAGLMIADKDGLEPVREIKDQPLRYFALAGKDGKWHWAEARIVGQTVVVESDAVPAPLHVRYAYAMNPKGPKLYNRHALPASPFQSVGWD